MTRTRLLIILSLLVVGCIGAAGYIYIERRTDVAATDAEACASVREVSAEMAAAPVSTGSRHIAVIGDSWSVGTGLNNPKAEAFPARLGQLDGATVTVHGQGRTGFVNGGYCGDEPFSTQVEAVLASAPDVVVIEGGLNDTTLEGVSAAAESLLASLKGMPIVVVGPANAPSKDSDDLAAVDNALSEAAAATGATYVPLLSEPIEFRSDDLHPTATGQEQVAELVNAALPR
ncbi:GDSL-type esterase/lipase family protein [Rhodococcoides fascians]|uniref:SGNH/GDSL hydrolase family protein n=1 Tax=Rhodococcoides fascians TaxID=1828 RepID=UPI002ACD83D7|nr:GDSL-type esterase/lipase family protein [Rhodococcus fascians]WQH26512.1 GDSL-type esterase/lipase family protein [Rhodococcus fascians]